MFKKFRESGVATEVTRRKIKAEGQGGYGGE